MTEVGHDSRLGVVALGDSITNGHGGMQGGLGSQSWAQWLAQAMELPFTKLARDGATADDVAHDQAPKVRHHYDVGCLYVGVNDVRGNGWDRAAYAARLLAAAAKLHAHADRLVMPTIPLGVGLPPAGDRVLEANEAIKAVALVHRATVVDLRDFDGPRWVWADRVHATAAGQVEIADRAARALGAPLPSQTVVDVPDPGLPYALHYARRTLRERLRVARQSILDR